MADDGRPPVADTTPPLEGSKPKVSAPKTWSTGAPAVASSLSHIVRRAGVGRGARALLKVNQHNGFDCPSCAWPDPDGHRALGEFCENGAKAVASEAMSKTIGREFFAQHSLADLRAQSDAWHDRQGRLAEPLLVDDGQHYRPISWDDAFALIGQTLRGLQSPHEALFYTSGRASNEAAFLYQLFARAFGTNNLPDCSNMCHESSGAALHASIGVGKGTVSIADIEQAEVILSAGQNPGTNHPRMLATLQRAVQNGAWLLAINPLKEAGLIAFKHPQHVSGLLGFGGTEIADEYLQVRVNGDMALFRGFAKALFAQDALDREFIAEHTTGLEAYRAAVDATEWSTIERLSGIPRREIVANSAALADTNKIITCWAMGLTQHHNAVATIREVVNVHLLRGAIGREGAGLCPVRGHSNVQGDRTVGIWEKMPESFLAALDAHTGIESPREHGLDTVGAIQAMHRGDAKVFVALGGNFLMASPDTEFVAQAMQNCDLTVQISTKLNRSHLVVGKRALILPCLGRSDDDGGRIVSTENSMGIVQSSQGRLKPASDQLRSEPDIIAAMATATVGEDRIAWSSLAEDYDRIRDLIEKVVPGFDRYNERVREDGGFYLPNAAKERRWNTTTGKAVFSSDALSAFEVKPGRLVLQTLRSHDQFNTTIYGLDDRYRGIKGGRRVVFLSPHDIEEHGLESMQHVDLTSYYEGVERVAPRFVVIPYNMPRGCAAAYFPEANALVPVESVAAVSNTPTSKSIEVSIQPSE